MSVNAWSFFVPVPVRKVFTKPFCASILFLELELFTFIATCQQCPPLTVRAIVRHGLFVPSMSAMDCSCQQCQPLTVQTVEHRPPDLPIYWFERVGMQVYLSDYWCEIIFEFPIFSGNITSVAVSFVTQTDGLCERTRGVIFALPSGIWCNEHWYHYWYGPPKRITQVEKDVDCDLVAAKATNLFQKLVSG